MSLQNNSSHFKAILELAMFFFAQLSLNLFAPNFQINLELILVAQSVRTTLLNITKNMTFIHDFKVNKTHVFSYIWAMCVCTQCTIDTDATQNQQVERSGFGGLQAVAEGLQYEYKIKKGAGVNRPNTLRWLSQSHRDEILTYFSSQVFKRFLLFILFRSVLYIETLGWLFPQ